jgi:hypothetical protein
MFFNKDESPFVRFFSGGSAPKITPPKEPVKQQETRRIDRSAEEARGQERKRVPPGRTSTMFSGIEKMLKDRLGK